MALTSTFTGTFCAYSQKDGQAELTWLPGYIPRWFTCTRSLVHPGINRAQRV